MDYTCCCSIVLMCYNVGVCACSRISAIAHYTLLCVCCIFIVKDCYLF